MKLWTTTRKWMSMLSALHDITTPTSRDQSFSEVVSLLTLPIRGIKIKLTDVKHPQTFVIADFEVADEKRYYCELLGEQFRL